jgi:hypothetical protein
MLVIDSGYFYAAVVLSGGVVTRSAPILKYMNGWDMRRVIDYAQRKRWRVYHVAD